MDKARLYNQSGQVVYQWPDGYEPGWEEVREKVKEILRQEGRRID